MYVLSYKTSNSCCDGHGAQALSVSLPIILCSFPCCRPLPITTRLPSSSSYRPFTSDIPLPGMELFIGIETEGFWKFKKGLDLGPVPADTESFARALTLRYNKENAGKNPLRADFSHGSHPGHYESASDKEEWIVATDSTIGGEMLDGSKSVAGRTCSQTLGSVLTIMGLTAIQIPSSLCLRCCSLA